MADLPKIPSEYLEPYLLKFMSSMIEFTSSACTEEEKIKRNGAGWTVDEVKNWVKGVELFVSFFGGIHAQYAMMNEANKFRNTPNDKLLEICKKVVKESFDVDS